MAPRFGVCALAILLAFAFGCGNSGRGQRFARLAEEFVYTSLSFSPVSATAAGLHQYNGRQLDTLIDDMSPRALDEQRRFYSEFRARLRREAPRESLSPEDRADYDILDAQAAYALLELDRIQSHLHNPTLYVELVGNALFNPSVLEYAPKPRRFRDIIARLQKIPLFLDQARTNLMSSPDIWTEVARQENLGNIDLVDRTLRAETPPELREEYSRAAATALDALRAFQTFLKQNLSNLDNRTWRLGRELYTRKFRYVLAAAEDPDAVLARAEMELPKVRARMLEMALPLHRGMYPTHSPHSELAPDERENLVISEVLSRIAQKHPTRENYIAEAGHDLEEARRFAAAKDLLTLPSRSNLHVIETPEFMRGLYAVGGFAPAPPLEPQLGAFYWVTPIPKDWPQARAESKLREYNYYKLKLLTIHEAMPGHYVQFEYANEVQPKYRRLLRSLYGNGPYVEGWAQYITQTMLDEGFLDHSPELRLTFLKEELRVLANAILDIRLHMLNMSDEEALALMERQTFQEREEATAKLQRAKLSSAQLPTYYVGWRGWIDMRERYRQLKGQEYRLEEFNDRALREGAAPLPSIEELLTGRPNQSRPPS